MAKLKVTRADGSVNEYQITPVIEYAFESHAKKGFHKAFRDDEKQSDVIGFAGSAFADRVSQSNHSGKHLSKPWQKSRY